MSITRNYLMGIGIQFVFAIVFAVFITIVVKRKNPDYKTWLTPVLAGVVMIYILFVAITGKGAYMATSFHRLSQEATSVVIKDMEGHEVTIRNTDPEFEAISQGLKGSFKAKEYESFELEPVYTIIFYEEDVLAMETKISRIVTPVEERASEGGVVSVSDGENRVMASKAGDQYYVVDLIDKQVVIPTNEYMEAVVKAISK